MRSENDNTEDMMADTNENGRVVIVSATDSFLAKSIMTKLEGAGIDSVFAHAKIREIENLKDSAQLYILFMTEELEEAPDTLA